MHPLLRASATELARKIRAREISSAEVLELHLARIRAVNPVINAVVAERFDEARREALAADARIRTEPAASLPPLLGVPCTIKESFALTGMPNCSGLAARAHLRSSSDAVTVARIRAAGAIPMGVTNTSELCMWMESANKVYGRSRNPYDPACIVGGSSGGEGAIVGSGASPFGLGSDIGGSIRGPAFFNGVFGHKPSSGLVPATGQFPIAHGDALRYLCTGPICRRAEDLMPLLRILAGPDGHDEATRAMPLGEPEAVSFEGLRVIDVPDDGRMRIDPELRKAQLRVAAHLAARGASVKVRTFKRLTRATEIWSSMLSAAGGTPFGTMLGNGEPLPVGPALLRWLVGRSPHTLPALGLALLEKLPALEGPAAKRLIAEGHALRAELADALGDQGIMLFPVYPSPAPKHVRPLIPPLGWQYTAIINVLEMPSTAVPLGLSRRAVPLGVQVASRHGNDHLCIAAAMELERAFGGWIAPGRLAAA